MSRKALLKHLWANVEGDGEVQICSRCALIRQVGAHGPRGGKGWSYYRNGAFIAFQTNNATQIKCERGGRAAL